MALELSHLYMPVLLESAKAVNAGWRFAKPELFFSSLFSLLYLLDIFSMILDLVVLVPTFLLLAHP
jgi:hypothetical protein